MEQGHTYLKTVREKTERAVMFLEEPEAEQLKEEVDAQLSQLEELTAALRAEQSSLEKCISLSKDFIDKYKAQVQWVVETKNLLATSVEPKAELYQKKAQLAKYKVTKGIFLRAPVKMEQKLTHQKRLVPFADHPADGAVSRVSCEMCRRERRSSARHDPRPHDQ